MKQLQAYKNDPELRSALIAEMKRHQQLDQIVKGTYGRGSNGDFKACMIGCAIHSLAHIRGEKLATDRHQILEDYLDIPLELADLFDGIFEGLPEAQAKTFPLRCYEAIRCGANLKMVVPQFIYWLLADPQDGVIRFVQEERFKRQKEAIEAVADLHRRTIAGETISAAAWAAALAAWDAARIRQAEKLIELLEAA